MDEPIPLSADLSPGLAPEIAPGGRGGGRQRAILDTALELFLERGFDGVSMGDVVKRAGGSLATIYRLFGSKEGLFEAILVQLSADIIAPLLNEEVGGHSLEEALQQVGETFLVRVLQPDALAWHRICVIEGPRHPSLRAAIFRTGPGRLIERLAVYLELQAHGGRLQVPDPQLAAAQFLSLVKAGVHLEAVCGEPVAADCERLLREHVQRAVQLFLHGCSPASSLADEPHGEAHPAAPIGENP